MDQEILKTSTLGSVVNQQAFDEDLESGTAAFFLPPTLLALAERTSSSAVASESRGKVSGLAECDLATTLREWAALRVRPGEQPSRNGLVRLLGQDVAAIDALISTQLDAVLHAPPFQRLESTWRGLGWLVGQAEEANIDSGRKSGNQQRIVVRVLSIKKKELRRDQEAAVEFDRSNLWRKVYEDEFGTAGGTPYGLLVTDHEFSNHPEDVSLLSGISETAMAAFAPLLAAPSPQLLGAENFERFESLPSLRTIQASPDYAKWRSLRERDESRFLGFPLPRVLARLGFDGWIGRPEALAAPEQSWSQRSFRYVECTEQADGSGRLWMSGVWPLAGVIVREFGRSGWFADIRGGSRGMQEGGEPVGLPVDTFPEGDNVSVFRGPTETFVPESLQAEIEEIGLIPLCATGRDGRAVFHSNMSLHQPKKFDTSSATANDRLSSMLQYVLCVSRFAQYLKVIMRDKLGGFSDAATLERYLSDWVHHYVTPDDHASAEARARMPLRAAEIEVQEDPGSAGNYRIIMRLQPHFQIDRIESTLRLVSTVRAIDSQRP